MVSETLRQNIRALYGFRCGYCGVTETESGSQLELDHFRSRSHGGQDRLDNLVYACRTCNSFPDGRLIGLTKRGWFYIHRLRPNRTRLIELRLQRVGAQRLRETLEHNRQAQARLQEYVHELEQEIERLLQIIAHVSRVSRWARW